MYAAPPQSGAGKTESVKIMMSMLAVASKSRAGASKQQEQRKGSKQLAGEGVEVGACWREGGGLASMSVSVALVSIGRARPGGGVR